MNDTSLLFQNSLFLVMRPMRGCKKPRFEAGSDEEDEAVYEPVIPVKPVKIKMSVEEDRKELDDERKQLKEEIKKVEIVKNKVEEDKAKVELAKLAVEEDRLMVEEERVKINKMSKELRTQVECPVCLTMPREDRPVPCCPLGHIVCSTCKDNLIRHYKFISILLAKECPAV